MRKRTIRKVWLKVNPIEHALLKHSLMPKDETDKLALRDLASLDAIVHGHGGMQEWSDINVSNNICQTLAEMGYGPEALETTKAVEVALIDTARRFEKTTRMGLTGPALKVIRDMLEYHDLQRQSVTRATYEKAINLVIAHTKSGHAIDVAELI